MNKLIAKIPKNSCEDLKIELSEYKGYQLLSLWIWTKEQLGVQESKPTHKGIAIQIDLLPLLLKALKEANKVLEDINKNNGQ